MPPRWQRFVFISGLVVVLYLGTWLIASAGAERSTIDHRLYVPFINTGLTGIAFEPVAGGFSVITDIASCGDGRLFVAQRDGRIHIIQKDGTVLPQPFLDIHSHIETADREQGLLGLAFDPDYAANGRFYITYTRDVDDPDVAPLVVARLTVDANNADRADPKSEVALLTIPGVGRIHQGGALRFGPDGLLTIGVGDGSNAPLAQDPSSLRGKLLRLDVRAGAALTRPDIWAGGLRNPYHIAYDHDTGLLLVADVGAHHWEEVNLVPGAGLNFGWPCLEGPDVLSNEAACRPLTRFTPPAFTYDHHGPHCAIIGGAVYRGRRYPVMDGSYLFGDFCSGAVWSLSVLPGLQPGGPAAVDQLTPAAPFIWTAAGEDTAGEVYFGGVAGQSSMVVRLTPGYP